MNNNSFGKAFSNLEISAFCGQMALILQSGISSTEGLEVMKEDCHNKNEEHLLDFLIEETRNTGSLFEALSKTNLFPDYMLNMIQIGEETGNLDEVMQALEAHYSREHSVSRALRSSLTFPLIMIGMMVVVIVVLLTVVLPIFNRVFLQLGSEMTGLSGAMLRVGNTLKDYSTVFLLLLAVIVILVLLGILTKKGRSILKKLGNIFPNIRKINGETASCRVASALSLTLKSGLNQDRCLELASQLNSDPDYATKLNQVKSMVEEGEDLSAALYKNGIFTGLYSRLSTIGEKTGRMDKAMEDIANMYQEDIDTRIGNTISVLEPTLVVILSVIVGIILLSIMLPLMGIMSGM